jgi:hypothetical protein
VTRGGGRGKGRVVVEDDGGAEERELGRVDGAFRLEFARLGCTRRRVSCHDPSFASSSAASHISSIADADLAAGPTCLIVAGTSPTMRHVGPAARSASAMEEM